MIPVIARLDNRDLGSVMNDLKREIQSQVNLPQGYHITYGLFVTNTPLNVGSYTGIIMIIGIIGENAIFTFLQFEQARKKTTTDGAIVYAISTRLRPKLMTALGAIIALSPIALGIGAGAQLHQPLVIAVIGGFIITLPMLLIVYPSMLRIIFKN